MFEKFTKKMVRNVGRAVKEETSEHMDDILSVVLGVSSVAVLLLSTTSIPKPVGQSITINNYYFGR